MVDRFTQENRKPSEGVKDSDRVRFGPFVFDQTLQTLTRDDQELELPSRSLLVLDTLLRSPGRTISREHLIDEVWQGGFVTDTSLTEAVSRLRQALGDGARQPRYIQTVHGRGYKFIASIDTSVVISQVAPVPREVASEIPKQAPTRPWVGASIAASLALVILIGVALLGSGMPEPSTAGVEPPPEGSRTMVRLAEVTMSGETRTRYGFPPLPLNDLAVDPIDGRLAFTIRNDKGSDVWMLHPRRGTLQRIASGGHFSDPVFTADGQGLALAHNRSNSIDLMYGALGSGQKIEVLLEAPYDQYPESFSRDGRALVYSERHPDTGFDLWLLRQQDDGRWHPKPLVRTTKHEAFGAISPDGRYVAYVSKGEGHSEVFALDLHREQAPVKVSRDGGSYPFWSASGDRLHYVDEEVVWTLDTAPLATGKQPSAHRSTPVAGVHLAAASSVPDGFVVAVVDGTHNAPNPSTVRSTPSPSNSTVAQPEPPNQGR